MRAVWNTPLASGGTTTAHVLAPALRSMPSNHEDSIFYLHVILSLCHRDLALTVFALDTRLEVGKELQFSVALRVAVFRGTAGNI